MRALQLPPATLHTTRWKSLVKDKICQAASQEWSAAVANAPRLHMAYTPPYTLQQQHYLSLKPFKGRQILTKLRCDDLPLAAASFNGYSPQLCPLCNTTHENRSHFLLECTALQQIRLKWKHNLSALNQTCNNPCQRLLCSVPLEDKEIIHTGAYLHELWHERAKQLGPNHENYKHSLFYT